MRTLNKIPDTFKLYAVCTDCGRMEEVDRLGVIEKAGDMTVTDFRSRVRCSGCGIRTEDIRIVYVGETGFGYRDH